MASNSSFVSVLRNTFSKTTYRRSNYEDIGIVNGSKVLDNNNNNNIDDDDDDELKPVDFQSQTKTLIIAFLSVIFFLGSGTLFYSLAEDWKVENALYYCIVTFTTVGYGSYHPTKPYTKIVACLYVLLGIALIGTALGIVGGWVLQRQAAALEKLMSDDNNLDRKKGITFWYRLKHIVSGKTFLSILFLILFTALGTTFFSLNEDLSFVDALYFTVITLSTVGYGDITPKKESSKMFNMFFVFIGTLVVAWALGNFADLFISAQQERLASGILHRKITTASLAQMDADGSGGVELDEFLEYMLVRMGKVSQSDIDEIKQQFRDLDVDGSGTLDADDLENL